ncbi:MAG TPA: cobalamin-binding protein [Methylomirabilota bacterium]|nr:cobalamin-binding protein [Methylomirabilota bacterium]
MPRLVDASGVALELARPPRRIVSLVPSTTETLCRLGLADALVGVTAYCVEPRDVVRSKTRVGGEKDPDLERIRGLAPDLVVANVEENVREHVATLRGWGIPVWVTYPRTVAGGLAMIRELGELTWTAPAAAALLAGLEPLCAAARAAAAARPPVSVFYPIWREPWMTVGADTYVHDVLALCGAANVFGDRPERYPRVTLAEVAARRPEVIVLPDEPFRFRRAHLKDFAPLSDVPAVRAGRIHLVDGKPFAWHGPRLAEALRTLPRLFGLDVGGSGFD